MLIVMLNNLAQTLKVRVNLVAMLVMFLFMMHTGNEQLENVIWTGAEKKSGSPVQ